MGTSVEGPRLCKCRWRHVHSNLAIPRGRTEPRKHCGSSSSLALPTLELEPKLPYFFFYTQFNDPDYPVLLRTSRGELEQFLCEIKIADECFLSPIIHSTQSSGHFNETIKRRRTRKITHKLENISPRHCKMISHCHSFLRWQDLLPFFTPKFHSLFPAILSLDEFRYLGT